MPYFLIALGTIARLVPHPCNFSPIGGLGLFAGANCKLSTAMIVPIAALLIADALTGFFEPVVMAAVYLGFVAGPLIGRAILSKRRSLPRYGIAVVSTTTVFFLISNFGAWAAFYPHTVGGLIECYVRAIPYYGATLLGDSIYVAVLFGVQEIVWATSDRANRASQG